MDLKKWNSVKRSGGFKRKVKNNYNSLQSRTLIQSDRAQAGSAENRKGSVSHLNARFTNQFNQNSTIIPCSSFAEVEDSCLFSEDDDSYSSSENEDNVDKIDTSTKNDDFRDHYKKWAIDFNITQVALKQLNVILNKRMPCIVPLDPRTLLKSKKEIQIIVIDDGRYWNNGLIECLKTILQYLNDKPKSISLNVNIDGLPLFNSSKHQVWPILCNIHEKPNVPPFVVGIYEGTSKPSNVSAFFHPFVSELQELMSNHLKIASEDGVDTLIEVKVRAFICDSPARALVKGVCNFNAKHGCLKCTVVGEYSHKSHTVFFPKTDCPRRNDADFRSKKYGCHHKYDSPLLALPIDMIEQFPVGDSLHIIDLGIMKRLLIGWRDGNFGTLITKWPTNVIEKVSQFLLCCQMPKEIHRSVRSLKDLSHWKGSEFRTFLLYLSYVILKDVLDNAAYHHFLLFFSTVTICTSETHFQLLPVAEIMLKQFVDNYGKFYGQEYITSNVHNLIHVVEEVKRFGTLQSFNAYPFENKLSLIKRMIRKGNQPLQQIANRLLERQYNIEVENLINDTNHNYPTIKSYKYGSKLKTVIQLESFILSTDNGDKWFLTNNNHLVELRSATCNEGHILIIGNRIENLRNDVFETPMKSSYLNIFVIYENEIKQTEAIYNITDIKCKLVSVSYNSNIYFAPLPHTFKK
ncbi:uncharacterized protein LOC121737423 [Aricia agestis]|uniref:uncharacterized protein LOC121737423 n=1 Tax=Aricia agestis TaxID=91739 RepID=UPI001C207219|nr:uncharacterized protein LOC121737423 [Aricia agestis]